MRASTSDEGEPQNPTSGDLWYDFNSHQLKVYDGTLNQWNTIGPQDIVHNDTDNQSTIATNTEKSKSYVIDKSMFQKNIYNTETETGHTGSLHLVTLKVLIKEVPNNGSSVTSGLRACAMIYRFVVQTISAGDIENPSYTISIFGAPNYEIIAKSDNLNFTTNLEVNGGNVVFTINNNSTTNNTYFVNGIDMEVTRA